MMALHNYPRCAAYLKAMRCDLDDPAMQDINWATILADSYSTAALKAAGTVNFDTMDGPELMRALEAILSGKRASAPPIDPQVFESLKAFFGSRGIKASKLKADDDFWTVARILWPFAINGKNGSLSDLHGILKGLTKRQRREASANIRKVPAQFLASSQKGAVQ